MRSTNPTLATLTACLREKKHRCTLLGVGPVSELVVRAAFEAFCAYDAPAIFIASRNQVDLEELGHGYLMGGSDQRSFVALLRDRAKEAGFSGPLYICRDHGGPWQRNDELDGKYRPERAMAVAEKSLQADIEAGFNYLHLDPTKCPFPHADQDIVVWTVSLLRYCESLRKRKRLPPIDYEVGTEDIQGGLTSPKAFESFIRSLLARLESEGLAKPTTIVGQTGTLARMDGNYGHFDSDGTRTLAAIAERYGIGLKEHNGDYLSAASCRIHPEIGVTGMNVAPEFGLVESEACLELARQEWKLRQEGWLGAGEYSGFAELLRERTFAQAPWSKWLTEDLMDVPHEVIEQDGLVRERITHVCGHYVSGDPEVASAPGRGCTRT